MISIIIPALNEAAALPGTLRAIPKLPADTETILVDGGSTDETVGVAGQTGARVLQCPRQQRAAQMNVGAGESRGDVLLFLHADTRLNSTSLDCVTDALRDPGVVGGAFARVFDHPSRFLQMTCWLATQRSRCLGWYLGDQAIFVRREVFEKLGGFADLSLFEDLDFSRRLGRLGRTRTLFPPIASSGRRFVPRGPFRTTCHDFFLTLRFLFTTGR